MTGRALALTVALAASASAQEAAPTAGCPCSAYGPYPCAAVVLVALPDQAAALGLSEAETDVLRALRETHLDAVHEILGDIEALREALHDLDRPTAPAEAFALLYDLGRHEAELDETFEVAAAALLDRLDAGQRARWDALVAEAADYQEPAGADAPVGCVGDVDP